MLRGQTYWVERLEERCLLTATPLQIGAAPPPDPLRVAAANALVQTQMAAASAASLMPVAPFPLEQTFLLHSDPTATKTIYLDFDGFITRNTQWNIDFKTPNIITPAYDLDGDFNVFSDEERLLIQSIWERVSEDFRPFNVDVTTQDPGVEALRNTGNGDEQWGQRVLIGGSDNDWYDPAAGLKAGGVSYGSFNWDSDTPNFVFAGDFGAAASDIAEAVSHETGHSLGLVHDSQFRYYSDIGQDPPKLVQLFVQYYGGHGSGDTAWAPIMGVGYGKNLTQWSQGEYFNATNDAAGTAPLQDDLEVITNRDGTSANGFTYRTDDHGDTKEAADPLNLDSEEVTLSGEGIIERNTDIDYFSFTVEGLGELVSFDIQPFHNGPDLDILAKIYDSAGNVVATGNSIDELGATFTDLSLQPGTYYVSVQGDGRPLTFLDPEFHPGPFEAEGNPPDPALPDDMSDWGYSNYASLGYYSIAGTRKKGLVVGVDFDVTGGNSPPNWNVFTGSSGPEDTLKNLKSEIGDAVPYQLTVSTTGTSLDTFNSDNGIASTDVPSHGIPLSDLDGFLSAQNQTLSFTWSNLDPGAVYQIYVFGHADFAATNIVTVSGGLWNGAQQTFNYEQDVAADGLNVNDNSPGSDDLATYAMFITAAVDGTITIDVTSSAGAPSGVAGVAIAPTKVGSISGQKWNDVNGDRVFDPSEDALEGWTIYLDLNNNGQLDKVVSPSQTLTQSSTDIPQTIPDQSIVGVKSTLDFTGVGKIEDVNVTLDITHGYDADLHATLISPSGTRVKLFTNVGSNGDNFHNTVLDDSALVAIANQQAPFTGTFRPEEPLSLFNDEDAAGQWKLELIDDAVGDTGVLNSWSLTIKIRGVTTFLEPQQVTNAAGRYTFESLPPGLYNVREDISPEQVAAGWRQTWAPAPLTLRSGANLQDVNIGNWIPTSQNGSIRGRKYFDSNQNGMQDVGDPGLPGWIVYIDSNHNGARDATSTPTQIQSADVPKPITDLHTTTSQINVASIGTVFNVEVTLDITHSFVADLDVFLISPSGRGVELFTGVGGQYNDFHNLTLSDSATRSISTIGFNDLPYSGTWKPEGNLSDFGGEDAAGIWTLVVTDSDAFDQGTLNSWSLSLTSGELFRTTDDQGNYEFDNLVPGNYTVREEPKPGWVQIPPADTEIPAAIWNGTGWDVAVVGVDDINDPDGPDSHRNVKNVDFGNHSTPAGLGDYNGDESTNAGDYVLWRKTRGTSVSPSTGADGNGNGIVDVADYGVWRSNFGQAVGSGSDAAAASLAFGADSLATSFNQPSSGSSPLLAATGGGLSMESDGGSSTASNLQSASSAGSSLSLFDFVVAPQSTSPGSTDVSAKPLSQSAAQPSEQNDLALLAWLSNSSSSSSAGASSHDSLTSQDSLTSHDSDEPDAVDVAFELLEGNALAVATI